MTPDRPEQAELEFLARQGIPQPDCFRITSGRNSRVWRIETDRGPWILKAYYRHAEDSRDRLGAEVGFLTFLQAHGIQGAPEPVAWSRTRNLALFTCLPGRAITTVQAWHIARAAAFIGAINGLRSASNAGELPMAADACQSIADHLALVEARLNRLQAISGADGLSEQVQGFVRKSLVPAFEQMQPQILARFGSEGVAAPLARPDLILSPSDFVFNPQFALTDNR